MVHTGFTERLEQRRRAAESRLGVHDHLFEFGLIALAALVVRGGHRFDRVDEQSGCHLEEWSASLTNQAGLLQNRQHDPSLSRADRRCCRPDVAETERPALADQPQAVDEAREVRCRRIAARHEERLQPPVRTLKQQDALRRQPIAPRTAGFLRVHIERGW